MNNTGWICPKCGAVHAPHINTCLCTKQPFYNPFYYEPDYNPLYPRYGEYKVTCKDSGGIVGGLRSGGGGESRSMWNGGA